MKFAIVIVLLLSFISSAVSSEISIGQLPDGTEYVKGKIVVVTAENCSPLSTDRVYNGHAITGDASIDRVCGLFGIERVEKFYKGNLRKANLKKTIERFYTFTLSEGADILEVMDALDHCRSVRSAELVSVPQLNYEPDDPFLFQQWYFDHTQALEAWDIVRGDTTRHSVIAIIDTGIDWEHEDLGPNIWINNSEDINGDGIFDNDDINGIDDDDNGFVDDVVGWDFGAGDNDPREDVLLHGSGVAGLASEATDNGILGAGMGFSARLMCVKAADPNGNFPIDIWQGIVYAADNGAQIINCSWGTMTFSQYEQDIINAVWAEDVIVLASAGANGNAPAYPAAYDHVMAVTATDRADHKTSFAGFGEWVDISAPGIDIKVIYDDEYQTHSGTSYAVAMASGLAALARAWFPEYTNDEIENLIKDSSDPIDHLNPGYEGMLGAGRINAYNCFSALGIRDDSELMPLSLKLRSSPNPFNPSTAIFYSLPNSGEVTLAVYNVLGQKISTLFHEKQDAGERSITWDASPFPSGVYFARLQSKDRTENIKMVLIK